MRKKDPPKTTLLRRLIEKETVVMPGAFNAVTAMMIEQCGFDAVYISGAGLASGVGGVPDIGLLTMTETLQQMRYIVNAVQIPALADADTGYGGPLQVMRMVRECEQAGLAGIHIEDQEFPKRCGHLAGKRLISAEAMAQKIAAAARARTDPDFLIVARTDARGVSGLDDAIDRARLYLEAGADMIFPEALESVEEFRRFAGEVDAPLLANMTEFGKTPYIPVKTFEEMGYRIVIFPLTAFRVMMKAAREALIDLKKAGTQKGLLDRMMTREELYTLIRYGEYEEREREIAKKAARKRKRKDG